MMIIHPYKLPPFFWRTLVVLLGCGACSKPTQEKEISLDSYQIQEGFRLEVIASEPLIESPVALDFDRQGRLWVVELPGYMADIDGTGEDAPTGKIVILTDTDGNGRMDKRTVFLDSLVAPRALLLAYGGLLYAEPPNLWFVEMDQDKPGHRTLVDSTYVLDGNIEHQSNGLLMNLDNWIYSANSNNRYKMVGGEWIREQTIYRGQWGLTKDYFGRLFYNDNANQFQGDFVLPNSVLYNPYQEIEAALRQQIVKDQRIYPVHSPFINRGYIEGELDEKGRPKTATSACGPLVYQGGLFPSNYDGNSFVCIPEGNLIKRNFVFYDSLNIKGRQAWQNQEFVTSTDQAFRPVNLYNGPNGGLFLVDMHRGVIQHRAYMSPYLRKKVETNRLDTITGMGRILRVVPVEQTAYSLGYSLSDDPKTLVEALSHPNIWVRDQAQQSMVQNQNRLTVPFLEKLILNDSTTVGKIHALWSLEGLNALTFDRLKAGIRQSNIEVKCLAFHLLPEVDVRAHLEEINALVNEAFSRREPRLDWYLAATLGQLNDTLSPEMWNFYLELARRYPENAMFVEAALSSLAGQEALLLTQLTAAKFSLDSPWTIGVKQVLKNRKEARLNPELQAEQQNPYGDKRQVGLDLYRSYCSACHGDNGYGRTNLAPPLYLSEYVTGAEEQLALIILHGLQGPIQIKGKTYTFNGAMPGMANNPELSDQDIQSIIHFVRNAFSVEPTNITAGTIQELRKQGPAEGQQYSPETLPKY